MFNVRVPFEGMYKALSLCLAIGESTRNGVTLLKSATEDLSVLVVVPHLQSGASG